MIGRVYKDEKISIIMGFDKFSPKATRRQIARSVRHRMRHDDRIMMRQIMVKR